MDLQEIVEDVRKLVRGTILVERAEVVIEDSCLYTSVIVAYAQHWRD
jgi:hypothetical protein